MAGREYFFELLGRYRRELLESVVPFWTKHAVDDAHGGLLTCIRDDGRLITTDKYMWSQLRALWTFSALCNHLGERPEWRAVADGIYRFVSAHGRDADGHWVFALRRDGAPHTGATSIYTDGFAIYGLTEYARLTGSDEALALARETFERTAARLARPGYPSAPYPIPEGVKAHGIAMIFALAFFELAALTGDGGIMAAAERQARDVMEVFRRPERLLVYEFVADDGALLDSPRGRAVVPGHAIESMWFMIHIYRHLGDAERVAQAVEAIGWHLPLGWDEEHGGLVLARDAEGGEPWWPFADSKLWWPHTEALYALLLAYEESGAPWCLEWFDRVDAYAFSRFPVPGAGEWTQKLTRDGQPFEDTVALPVKDPFHLPRALLYCVLTLERLAGRRAANSDGPNSDGANGGEGRPAAARGASGPT